MRSNPPRRGYAMLMVMVTLALLLSMYAVGYRHVTAALRGETATAVQKQRDEGSVHALARGLALLETGPPPSDPYVGAVTLDTARGLRSITLTFTSESENTWRVHAGPTEPPESPPPLPTTFAD